jgi:hypothetical protein
MSDKALIALEFIESHTENLIAKRKAWEEGTYKRSNEELYQLLSDCLDFYSEIYGKPSQIKALNHHLTQQKIEYKESTNLGTKIVRLVFDSNFQRRVYTYAKVIDVAHKEMKYGQTLSDFITSRGGVEEIRKTKPDGKSPAQLRGEHIETAKEALSLSAPLVEPFEVKTTLRKSNPGADHKLFVAIMREEQNGSYSMVYETSVGSVVNAALEAAGKDETIAERRRSAEERRRENEFVVEKASDLAAMAVSPAQPEASIA